MDTWAKDDAEREALCDDLAGLDASQWDVQSFCPEWKVRHVVAHQIEQIGRTGRAVVVGLVKNGMNANRFIARDALIAGAASPESLVTRLRATIGTHKGPPMASPAVMLVETVCHSADIRCPLGIKYTTPEATLVEAADTLKRSNIPFRTKKRIGGLRLVATNAAWSTGEGPSVEGPLESLILVMAGRPAGFDDLTGEGTSVLSSRT